MIDWLKKRLTPAKAKVDRWVHFAEALQQLWEENFDGYIEELKSLSSVFLMNSENLQLTMDELGDYFRADVGTENDWPIQVLWRRLELQAKESDDIIQRVLKRKFLGLNIQWVPRYAHKTDPYGTNFKKLSEIEADGLDVNDYFLTSRGQISLISPDWERLGMTFSEFAIKAADEIRRTLPTHIVYDGTDIIENRIELNMFVDGYVVEGIHTSVNMVPFYIWSNYNFGVFMVEGIGTTINMEPYQY